MFEILTSAQKQTTSIILKSSTRFKAGFRLLLAGIFLFAALPASALTYVTSGEINPNNNKPYPWTSKKAWLVLGSPGTPLNLPTSNDDVILNDSLLIPQGNYVHCKSLVLNSTLQKIALTIGSGSTLKVEGDVEIKSPDSGINTIYMPQGILLIDGNLVMGEKRNNGIPGTAAVFVAGPATSPGLLKVKGNISNQGKFNSPYTLEVLNNGVLELGGSLTNSNLLTVTFSAGSTVKFDGVKAQSLPASVVFGNVQVANNAGVFLSGPLTTTNLLGNLEVLSGRLENNGLSISGRGARSLVVKNGARLVLSGSSAFPTGFGTIDLEPASTVAYDGAAHQNVAVQPYGNLELLGSVPGTPYRKLLLGNVTARNTVVAADLMLDLGSLQIGNNTLTLKPLGAIRNYSTAHYIVVGETGRMVVETIGQSLGARSTEVIFPVGTATNFTPAYITNSGTTNNFAVGVKDGVINYANNAPLTQYVVKKTWDVECLNQVGNVIVALRLQWNPADEGVGFDEHNCFVTHYTGGTWSRSDLYQDATLAALSANMEALTTFSPFSVASGFGPLPVELISFKAVKKENNVLLTWETASEKNNLGYEVMASADGANFETVGKVATKNGNAAYNQRYEFLDRTARTGLVYYRLKQTDLDGTVTYYATKVLNMGNFTESLAAYPNPFRNQFDLKLQTGTSQEIQLQLTDLTGKTVYQMASKVTAGQTIIPIELKAELPAGMYILTAKTAGQLYTSRLIKE